MYQALYRKWRPQTFDQVVGQNHITDTLKTQVRTGRLSHAYIFIGTRGTGKTPCARILAKAVNCHAPVDGNPCGKCPACLGITDGSIMDVVEIDAASNNKVDDVRALREEAIYSPSAVKKRVYIVDEVHMLSTSAFNALLKILEEPPEHLMFILATTELQKVPATILSRCQRHSFRRIDTPQIAEYLSKVASSEGMKLTPEGAELIARMAEGGVRDALSLLDQCSASETIDVEAVFSAMGLAGNRRIARMLEHVLNHDTASALSDFSGMWMDGKDPASFVKEFGTLLRDVLIMQVADRKGASLISGGYDKALLKELSNRISTAELMSALEILQRCSDSLRDTRNPRLAVELCLVSLCESLEGESVNSLRARIERLEAALASGAAISQPVQRKAVPKAEVPELVPDDFFDDRPPMPDDSDIPWSEDEPIVRPVIPVMPETVTAADEVPAKPQQTAEAHEAPAVVSAAPSDVSWADICAKVSPGLAMDLKMVLGDDSKISGSVRDGVLTICAANSFVYGRFNKSEVLNKFSKAASQLSGRDIRVVLTEGKIEGPQQRSLDELKAFKEVKFI